MFIDLSKEFDNVNHFILLEKLHLYGVKGKSFQWFHSYMSHRKQNIAFNEESTSCQTIMIEVPQRSTLGPLIYLNYVNKLHRVSTCINPIMFADKANLFYSSKNIKTLFGAMNVEPIKSSECLKIKKLSINIDKTDFILFHPTSANKKLPLKLPLLSLYVFEIKQVS